MAFSTKREGIDKKLSDGKKSKELLTKYEFLIFDTRKLVAG